MQRGIVFIALLLSVSLFAMASAQETTGTPVEGNPVAQPLTVYSAQGDEAAQITVTEVVDPFTDWLSHGKPQQDERYVLLTAKIEVTGKRPFEFEPYSFYLLDSLGRLYSLSSGYIPRSDQSKLINPDLERGNLLPGESVSGAVSYRVPADAKLTHVVFMSYADAQFLYFLADLSEKTAAESG